MKRSLTTLIPVLLVLAISGFGGAGAWGTTLYVDDDSPNDPGPRDPTVSDPAEDGSPDTYPAHYLPNVHPFDSIQEAINAAVDGDTIIVLDGLYKGPGNRDIDFMGKAITLQSDKGYSGCTVSADGTRTAQRRCFIFQSGEGPNSVVDGFRITRGYLIGEEYDIEGASGAGILCTGGSSPTIINNYITGNLGTGELSVGGGIACLNSSPTITGNTLTFNEAFGSYGGGAIYCYNSSSVITENYLAKNIATFEGGGIYTILGAPIIERNDFIENFGRNGAGLCSWSAPQEIISATIVNNVFALNDADEYGGGLYCWGDPPPTIDNCTFSENIAGMFGRGMAFFECNALVFNCIVWRNDFETAVAKYEPPLPSPKVTGTDGVISDDGLELTSASIGNSWGNYEIDVLADVCIISDGTGGVLNGTYTIGLLAADGLRFPGPVGTPDWNGEGNPIGTCSFWVGPLPCPELQPAEVTETVFDIAISGECTVRLRYCLISMPDREFGGIYTEEGGSYRLLPFYRLWPPAYPVEDIFVGPGYLIDRPGTPCDPTDDWWVEGSDWHLVPGGYAAIDRGDPTFDFGLEPIPNGAQINIGAYGNTDEAALSDNPFIIIEGPDDRGEDPAIVTDTDPLRIDIYGDNMPNFNAMQIGLRFLDALGVPSSAFQISLTGGDPDFGGQAIDYNDSDLPPIAPLGAFPVYDAVGRQVAGIVLPPLVGTDLYSKTRVFSIWYDYTPGLPDGTYQLAEDPNLTIVRDTQGEFFYQVKSGSLTLIAALPPCVGDVTGNGVVDILDMIFVRDNLNQDPQSDPDAAKCDINKDGQVNILDLLIVRTNFGACP